MKSPGLTRALRLSASGVAALALAVTIVLVLRQGGGAQARVPQVSRTLTRADTPAGVPSVTVGGPLTVRRVASGFLGLSLEYYAIKWYGGAVAAHPDPVFLQLLHNLVPDQRIVLRVGGDSADWVWLATPGVVKGPALKVTINATTIAVLAAIVRDLNAKVILDLNLADRSSKLADNIARRIRDAVGPGHIEEYELGNEPDLYDVLGWYTSAAGTPVKARANGYSVADYTSEFDQLGATLPDAPLAGPATSRYWNDELGPFITSAHRLKVVTMHDYPLYNCNTKPGSPNYPTINHLLSARSTLGMAQSLALALGQAHAAGKQLRVDELNSVACFGKAGVSDTYAAALWALETTLQFARAGYDGLNFTSVPSAFYRLFVLTHHNGSWQGTVLPEYYGLLAFADAVPPGSRFLSTPDSGANPQVFAVRTPSGQTRVIAVNTGAARKLALRIPGGRGRHALVTDLDGPSLRARSGTTLAGQSFGAPTADGDTTTTGDIQGTATGTAILPVRGAYVVSLPAHSAAILSVPN